MSEADDTVRMRHMLEHAREAVALLAGRSRSDLGSDRQLQLSLLHLIAVVGEAANRVSSDTQQRHPGIEWREATTARNRIVHGYDSIDHDIVWEIATRDFPRLIRALENALAAGTP